MNLAMDASRLMITANYPYPNLLCTLNFKCDSDKQISQNIIASSYYNLNVPPDLKSNNLIIQTLPATDFSIFGAQTISVDVSQLFTFYASEC